MNIWRWLGRRTVRGNADTGEPRVILTSAVAEAMREESEYRFPAETGGVLVGHDDGRGRTIITAATGPGPQAMHSRNRFRRDGTYAQAEVDRLHALSDGGDDYVGEWHSHPDGGGPSGVDFDSMAWVGTNTRYSRNKPFLVIVQRSRSQVWQLRVFRWGQGRLNEMQWAAEISSLKVEEI